MEFGIFTWLSIRQGQTEHEAFREWLDIATIADDLGVDCYWLAEFHFRPHTPLSAPLVLGSNIAARTKRMKIGVAVQLLPLANPLRLAEETATLDHVSEGRFVYGIGRSSFVDSYEGYGVDYGESRPMFFEALEVIRRSWRDEPFTFEGQHFRFRNVNVVPKPYQRPHPPIRIACESRASFPMMGELGFPILFRHQLELSELQGLLKQYEQARHGAGFDGPNELTLQTSCHLGTDSTQARCEADASMQYQAAYLARIRKGDAEAAVRSANLRTEGTAAREDIVRRQLIGTPEEVVDRLAEYRETLGITGVSLAINPGGQIPREHVITSLRLLMEKVAPHFK
jgi:alkanesulfonate monooxygenase SsuD/methylene tetrahydromethanopterin reductase-like flavin-dependent oxidoreductase (luciferase family)